MKQVSLYLLVFAVLMVSVGCGSSDEPQIIYVTATPPSQTGVPEFGFEPTSTPIVFPTTDPLLSSGQLTPNPPRFSASAGAIDASEHIVAAGDTLGAIAQRYGTTAATLQELNNLPNPDIISVGQVLKLPEIPTNLTPSTKLLPDTRLVRGVLSRTFDVNTFVAQQAGYITNTSDVITERTADGGSYEEILSGAAVVERVSIEFGVDARLLLAALEYRAGWLSQQNLPDNLKTHPLISAEVSLIDRSGLYKQLSWFANELNRGYYGWKYEGWDILEFPDGVRLRYSEGLNAATVGLLHVLRLNNTLENWQRDIGQNGFIAVYQRYFGDPFIDGVDVYVPPALEQPLLQLPFTSGETWFFTGGAHGGWGSGSAWAAVDFAPPDERTDNRLCYVSDYPVKASADGIVARSERGAVVLDLDGDGDETTGWTIFYLHLTSRAPAGARVRAGDTIGYSSCEGGVSTATHLHIGRRYNGEWIPATCFACPDGVNIPAFTLSNWRVVGLRGQEYQGYMERNGDRRTAEQGRLSPINRISW